ncbi:hypothetical protein IWZ01DRAFT_477182 [Phyllosticta capitalensis]
MKWQSKSPTRFDCVASCARTSSDCGERFYGSSRGWENGKARHQTSSLQDNTRILDFAKATTIGTTSSPLGHEAGNGQLTHLSTLFAIHRQGARKVRLLAVSHTNTITMLTGAPVQQQQHRHDTHNTKPTRRVFSRLHSLLFQVSASARAFHDVSGQKSPHTLRIHTEAPRRVCTSPTYKMASAARQGTVERKSGDVGGRSRKRSRDRQASSALASTGKRENRPSSTPNTTTSPDAKPNCEQKRGERNGADRRVPAGRGAESLAPSGATQAASQLYLEQHTATWGQTNKYWMSGADKTDARILSWQRLAGSGYLAWDRIDWWVEQQQQADLHSPLSSAMHLGPGELNLTQVQRGVKGETNLQDDDGKRQSDCSKSQLVPGPQTTPFVHHDDPKSTQKRTGKPEPSPGQRMNLSGVGIAAGIQCSSGL